VQGQNLAAGADVKSVVFAEKPFQLSIDKMIWSPTPKHSVKEEAVSGAKRRCGPQISSTAADPSALKLIRAHYGIIERC
jgi:hypothetical protein